MAKKKTSKFKSAVVGNTQQQQKQGAQYGHLNLPKGVSVFKEEPGGKAALDFLPYEVTDHNHPDRNDALGIAVPEELWYKRPYRLHRNIGMNNDSAVCPGSIGKKCPVCEYRGKLLKEGSNYQDDEVKALKPSLRNLYIVIPKGMKDYDEKAHIWDISQFLFQDALNEEIEENEDNGIFPDLEVGLTLRIRFSKEEFGKNKFAKTSRIDFDERNEQYDEKILKQIPNLDEVLTVPSYKQLEAQFFELEDEPKPEEEPEGEDEPEERPERKKKKANPEPKEQESEEEEEESEEEPEPEPVEAESKPKKESENKCPYGYRFGVDIDEYDECDECDLWDECIEEKEG